MSKYYVLFNPIAGNCWDKERELEVRSALAEEELCFFDITKIKYENLVKESFDNILIVGGDGTLNRFINDTQNIKIDCPVFYLAGGSGNDFLHDICGDKETPVQIDKYLKQLPSVIVNGNTYKFLNGIGYGIDGYCCEVGDDLKEKSTKPINYTSIAIKGLLFHFHPANAKVTVDGTEHTYKKVWLAPTMNGRFYGGAMMPTPGQDRLNEEKTLSTLVWYGKGKLRTLIAFPSIFKGEHIKHKEMCEILTGKTIKVEFDRPTALQIDGETIKNVSSYTVVSYNEK